MKIAILGPAPPYRGGISLFALMLARTWAEAGHELCFFNFHQQYPKLLFPGKEQIDSSLDEREFPNQRVLTPWLPHTWVRTAQMIKQFKPDILVISWFIPFFAPAYAVIMKLLPNVRKVLLAHNISSHEKWLFMDKLTKLVFMHADEIVTLSRASMNEIKSVMPLSVYNKSILGFHPIYSCYSNKPAFDTSHGTKLLFFGLIKPYKGLDVLLDAMPLVLARFPQVKLQIAGEVYGEADMYLKQISDLGIGKSVELSLRYISEPEIQEIFGEATLCILPYKSASQSGVIATSYSFGVPVLVTDVGGLSEYVRHGETGYVVEANNPQKIAETIIGHLEKGASSMREAISKHNEQNSWQALCKIIEQGKIPVKRKKLLLISYYFPPCGGAAVQRWLRLLPALVDKGYQVTVITTENGDYPHIDTSLLAKVPSEIKVLRSRPFSFTHIWRALGQKELPYGSLEHKKEDGLLKRALYWIRLNVIIPDARIGWNGSAYKLALTELRTADYDGVITTGPPHSTHLIGYKLKQKHGVRWFSDFRDPWSEIYYLQLGKPSKLTMLAHKYLEAKVIKNSDAVLVVSKAIAHALPAGNKAVLYNGYSAEDFTEHKYQKSDKFRIKYVGQLTAGQNIQPLKQALQACKELAEIELSFIGTGEVPAFTQPVRKMPFVPHREAIREIVNAELVVLVINDYQGFEGMLTTKLFEYIAARTPILCISKPGGEAEELINRTNSGLVSIDPFQIAEYIKSLYSKWLNNEYCHPQGRIEFLEVKEQVEAITSLL